MCRAAALQIGSLKPILDKHNIRLVGIGLGYNSLDGFLESRVWEGLELYVDDGKKMYKALGLGEGNIKMVLDKNVRDAKAKADKLNVGGNYSGDGMQLGGTYVFQDDKILYEYQQQKYGDHPTRENLLKALGLEDEIANLTEVVAPTPKVVAPTPKVAAPAQPNQAQPNQA